MKPTNYGKNNISYKYNKKMEKNKEKIKKY